MSLVYGISMGISTVVGSVTPLIMVESSYKGTSALKLFGVSIIWYAALILYGYATFRPGNIDSTVGWVLFNALALIISVLSKLKTGKWKGSKKTLLFTGCFILIVAWIIVSFV